MRSWTSAKAPGVERWQVRQYIYKYGPTCDRSTPGLWRGPTPHFRLDGALVPKCKKNFHLSVVATTRNDDHGENLLHRMQCFVDGFVEQCKRHHLNAELILVEWNPPEDRPPLSQTLDFSREKGPCAIRIIRVPNQTHAKLDHSDRLPLFQMIGKNVGIQRALGKFILATNIDILFSDALIKFMRDRLKPGFLYRTDRLDIPKDLPQMDPFDQVLRHCSKNFFRINGRFGTIQITRPIPPLSKKVFLFLLLQLKIIGNYTVLLTNPFFLLLKGIKNIGQLGQEVSKHIFPLLIKNPFFLPMKGIRKIGRLGKKIRERGFLFSLKKSFFLLMKGIRKIGQLGKKIRKRGFLFSLKKPLFLPMKGIKKIGERGFLFFNKLFQLKLFKKISRRNSILGKKIRIHYPLISLRKFFSSFQLLINKVKRRANPLHTNACGDFTLLFHEDWEVLRGYPEWKMASWHLDTVLLFQAKQNGIKEFDLPRAMSIYHIEHGLGSGYTPEGSHLLFKRYEDKGIPYLQNSDLKELIEQLECAKQNITYNQKEWGMANQSFEELWV